MHCTLYIMEAGFEGEVIADSLSFLIAHQGIGGWLPSRFLDRRSPP